MIEYRGGLNQILSIWRGKENEEIEFRELISEIKKRFPDLSERTIIRYLNALVENKKLKKVRRGRKTYYQPTSFTDVVYAALIDSFFKLSEEDLKKCKTNVFRFYIKKYRERIREFMECITKEPLMSNLVSPFVIFAFNTLELDPLNLGEEPRLPEIFGLWLIKSFELKFAEEIANKFTSQTTYEDFIQIAKEVYSKDVLFLYSFRPSLFFSEFEKRGIFRLLYKKLKNYGKGLRIRTTNKERMIQSILSHEKGDKTIKEKIKKLFLTPKVDEKEYTRLFKEFYERIFISEKQRMSKLQRELESLLSYLDWLLEVYVMHSLLYNLGGKIIIEEYKT